MRPLPNPYLHGAVVGGLAIQFVAASLPLVSNMLGNAAMPVELCGVVFVGGFVAWGTFEGIARVVSESGEVSFRP